MGFMDTVKGAVGMGGEDTSESDEVAEEWADDVESDVSESDEEIGEPEEVETEPIEEEWDSAYKFAEEFLEMRGFASMMDFTNKCMAYKISQSPMYRDRISNGVDTMNRITSMHDQMAQISGENSEEVSYAERAEKLENANRVIDQAQKLSGQEDAMINELIGMGRDVAEGLADAEINVGGKGNVESSVTSTDEEL